jgi:hypothetical protein
MKTLFTEEELQTGDFVIAINSHGGYTLGFYIGKGSGKSHQFYDIYHLSNWINSGENSPRKSYIPKAEYYNFIKYSAELITNKEELETYERAIEVLKILKIIEE